MTMPVSGPGPYSRRTDKTQPLRELPDAEYGEAKTFRELQQGAPLAADPGAEAGPSPEQAAANAAAARVIPLGAPSQQPGTPVTDGAAAGPGQGFEALGMTSMSNQDYSLLAEDIGVLEFMANQPGASWAMRNLVRRIKGTL